MRVFISFGGKWHPEEGKCVAEYIYENIKNELPLFENKEYVDIMELAIKKIHSAKPQGAKEDKNDDPLFGDVEEKDKEKYVEPIHTHFYTQHPNEKIRNLAIDLLTEQFSYADWESRGVELQTQKIPEENYVKDAYQAIIQFKLRKIQVTLKNIKIRIDEAKEKSDSKQIIALLQAYKLTLEYRNNLAAELQQIVLAR